LCPCAVFWVISGVLVMAVGRRQCYGGAAVAGLARVLRRRGGGATTLRHYADPVPEVDRRAAAYLAQLTARSTRSSPPP
jgi:hypothetical protein